MHDAAKKTNCYVMETRLFFSQSLTLENQKHGYEKSRNRKVARGCTSGFHVL